ncbi:unnamed protein product [Blepharisma stoltei]|uniref:Down syndrome critical region protein 3 n=1 Tax=Blepharisma stoltei TaxID=1481888 RepID=A0AAU9JWP9_9CILI|nr:unnamed protein product [Blepharisma stoltei]
MKAEIVLERNNKTFTAGEQIRGHISIEDAPIGIQYNNLIVNFDGYIRGQASVKNVGALDSLLPQVPPQTLCKSTETLPGGTFTESKMIFPFVINLVPIEGQFLLETYIGVYITIQYEIKSVFVVSENVKNRINNPNSLKIVVQVPDLGLSEGMTREKVPVPFNISPASIENPGKLSNVPNFRIVGELASSVFELNGDFNGWLSVMESSKGIKSIELQVIRIESITSNDGTIKEATEVQSLQIADGNVRKGAQIPLFMLFPRQFTCPTTFYKKFRIEFEVNLVILFFDGYQITKNFPLHLIR